MVLLPPPYFFFLGEVSVYDCFGDAHVSAGFPPKSGVPVRISSVSRGIFKAWMFLLGLGGIGSLPCATFIRCTVGVLGAGCGSLLAPRDSASSSTSKKPQRSPPKFQNCKALGALLLPWAEDWGHSTQLFQERSWRSSSPSKRMLWGAPFAFFTPQLVVPGRALLILGVGVMGGGFFLPPPIPFTLRMQ